METDVVGFLIVVEHILVHVAVKTGFCGGILAAALLVLLFVIVVVTTGSRTVGPVLVVLDLVAAAVVAIIVPVFIVLVVGPLVVIVIVIIAAGTLLNAVRASAGGLLCAGCDYSYEAKYPRYHSLQSVRNGGGGCFFTQK